MPTLRILRADAVLTLLRNADLYSPTRQGKKDILVAGGAISAVGEGLPLLPSEICTTVELGGARVIPGLIDAHVHLTGGGGESGPASRVPPVPMSMLSRSGVTTAVGVLGTDGTTRSVQALVAATLGLREEGLSAFCWTGSYEVPPITVTGNVRSDIVFIDPVIGVGELAISDHRSSQPTFDEFIRIAADCHVAGMMSGKAGVLHLHLGDGPRGLDFVRRALDETELPASTFYPTHVNRNKRLFKEALEIAPRGVYVDVTAFPVEEGDDAISAADAIVRFYRAGAAIERVTCSSDGGGCLPTFDANGRLIKMDIGRPGACFDTLRELLSRGLSLETVLPAFTTNVSAALRLKRKGRIEVGADADLVVLDDKHQIHHVMANGRFVVRSGEPNMVGTFEAKS